MHYALVLGFLYFASCSGSDQDTKKESGSGDAQTSGTANSSNPRTPPAAIKENLTLIGAVITSIQLINDHDYSFGLMLRSALPAGGGATIAEPGQQIVVRPAFVVDESGNVLPENDRNKRLLELRKLAVGGPLIGKIAMTQDGTWYLVDTDFE